MEGLSDITKGSPGVGGGANQVLLISSFVSKAKE